MNIAKEPNRFYMENRERGAVEMPLLDVLAYKMQCEYLSDLHFLPAWQWERLAREVERIPHEAALLREWNDALDYLTGSAPEPTAEAAKQCLKRKISQKGRNTG